MTDTSTPEAVAAPPEAQAAAARPRVYRPIKKSGSAGYWSFVMLAIFALFLFYVAGKNELQQWIDVLIPKPPTPPKAEGAGQSAASGGSAPLSDRPLSTLQSQLPLASAGQQIGNFIKGITGIPTGAK